MLNSTVDGLINWIIIIFFSLSICLPKSYSTLKLVLLVCLCVIAILSLFQIKTKLKRNVFNWYLLFICYYLIWIGIGSLNGNNLVGLIDTVRLYVIYTFIFLLFTMALSGSKKMSMLFKIIMFSNFLIAINTILLFTNAINLTNIQFLYTLMSSAGGSLNEGQGYTKIGADNINSLFFTFPFLLTYYRTAKFKNKKFIIINIVVTIFAVIISGRRMIQLVSIFFIIINYISSFTKCDIKVKKKNIAGLLCILLVSFGVIYTGSSGIIKYFSADIFYQRTMEAFEASSNNIRYVQIVELFKAFLHKPILGVGFGKGITSIVRSASTPWSYEVTYVLQLYQTGIIGIMIYISLLYHNIHLALTVKKRFQDDIYIIPLLYGYVSFLIACFSNPLFGNFDFMWVLFIIPTYYNYLETNTNKMNDPLGLIRK